MAAPEFDSASKDNSVQSYNTQKKLGRPKKRVNKQTV